MENTQECLICLEYIQDGTEYHLDCCNQIIHDECYQQFIEKSDLNFICPHCRSIDGASRETREKISHIREVIDRIWDPFELSHRTTFGSLLTPRVWVALQYEYPQLVDQIYMLNTIIGNFLLSENSDERTKDLTIMMICIAMNEPECVHSLQSKIENNDLSFE